MIKIKYFEYIGVISLLLLSIIFTKKTAALTKDIDEIMIEIKNNYSNYNTLGMDANIIDNKYIIPGKCIKHVNIYRSYYEMKKVGFYNPDSYIYKVVKPKINIYNNLDKYIINGNKEIPNIYIFINLNYANINNLYKYNFTNYNFIVNYEFYINNKKIISNLIKNNNSILISNTSKNNIKKVSSDYLIDINKNIFCYNNNEDDNYLHICSKYKSNSIIVINSYDSNYLYNIKPILSNGVFLKFTLNDEFINEVSSINKYIESKGYIIRNVDNYLGEC